MVLIKLDLFDIYDGALGTIQAMECEEAKHDIFHIGNDVGITIEELAKRLANTLDILEVMKCFNLSRISLEDVQIYQKLERCLIFNPTMIGNLLYIIH